jgi:accessory gene regulator B
MAKNVSSFFVSRGIILEEDREVYVFSFEILFSTLQSTIALAVLSLISGTVIATILFLIGFVPLRVIAGGYHAKNHFRCFLITMFTYTAFLLLLFCIPVAYIIPIIYLSVFVSVVIVFLFAPSEDSNKPLSDEEKILFRKRSRLAVILYTIFIVAISVIVTDKRYALYLALGVLSVGITLMANLFKYKKSNRGK